MGYTGRASDSLKSRLLAHRGFWFSEPGFEGLRPNSAAAIERASSEGFGLETDIRDRGLKVAIEHDAFTNSGLYLEEILHLSFKGLVCLNVKSDGLGGRLKDMKIWNRAIYFDLSIPELLKFEGLGLPVADRLSEYEKSGGDLRENIWLDAFVDEWWTVNLNLDDMLESGKNLIVVSPELHKRPHLSSWAYLKPLFYKYDNLHLCTDLPISAYEFMRL
ncbi:hypothetical protein MCETARE7_00037 [Candidatus Nanopelagicaceae bacterium]